MRGPPPSHLPTLGSAHPIGLKLCSDHPGPSLTAPPCGWNTPTSHHCSQPLLFPEPLRLAPQGLRLPLLLPYAPCFLHMLETGQHKPWSHTDLRAQLLTRCVMVPEPLALSGSHPLF